MQKVIIAGAGMGGILLAELLGKQGYTVTVYEKSKEGEVCYDWHDDVTPHVFKRIGIPLPDEKYYFKKKDWSFCSPFEEAIVKIKQDDEKVDLSMERRPLSKMLIDRAAVYADFRYESVIEGPIVKDNKVVGVTVNGRAEYADLVVDSLGAFSSLRTKLPKELGIQNFPDNGEIFHAYRSFVRRAEGVPYPEHTNKAYLKHLGGEGISWCIMDNNPSLVNVLVGRVDNLSKKDLQAGLDDLKARNPVMTDEVLRGGITCIIPIRYPLTLMVADGYAAIGDSAFFTIPMLGSGIASSLLAATFLADVISKKSEFTKENLWNYEVAVFKEFGARHAGVDVLKRWLLSAPAKDVAWLLGSGVISEDDMKKTCVGELIKLTPKDLIGKLKKGIARLPLLLKLNGVLGRVNKAVRIASKIPTKYDKSAIDNWQARLKRVVK